MKTIVSFCLHWNPSLLNTRTLIDQGAIGKPYYIEVDYWHGMKTWYPQYPWSVKKPQGGSSLLSAGCHALDAMRWFAGDRQSSARSDGLFDAASWGQRKDWGYDPTIVLICKFASGAIGKMRVDSRLQDAVSVQHRCGRERRGRSATIACGARRCFPGRRDGARCRRFCRTAAMSTHHPFNGQIEAFVARDSGWQAGAAGYRRCDEDARADFRGGSIGGDGETVKLAIGKNVGWALPTTSRRGGQCPPYLDWINAAAASSQALAALVSALIAHHQHGEIVGGRSPDDAIPHGIGAGMGEHGAGGPVALGNAPAHGISADRGVKFFERLGLEQFVL